MRPDWSSDVPVRIVIIEVVSGEWMERNVIFVQHNSIMVTCVYRATLKEMEPSHDDEESVRRRPSLY